MKIRQFLQLLFIVFVAFQATNAMAQVASVTPTLLTFPATVASTTSAPMDVTLNATYLNPSSGPLTVSAPANYQVYNGSSWVSSYTIAYSCAGVVTATISTRFNSPAATGTYTTAAIVAGGGIGIVTIGVSAVSTAVCTGTPSPGVIRASSYVACGSTPLVLTDSGTAFYSNAGISIQWQSSPDSSTWSDISAATNATYNASLAATTYFRTMVRCPSSGGISYSAGARISYSSTCPTISTSPTSLTFPTTAASHVSAAINAVVVGSFLSPSSGSVTVTAPTRFQVYNGSAWVSSYTISYSGSAISATTVPIRFLAPATDGSYTGNLVISGGSASKSIPLAGNSCTACVPTVSSDSFGVVVDRTCSGVRLIVRTDTFSGASSVKTWFGDGTRDSSILASAACVKYCTVSHSYSTPGMYTIKQVLYSGAAAIDSLSTSFTNLSCNVVPVVLFLDLNRNCRFDSSDMRMFSPATVEIDSNSVPIDTISVTSGLYYSAFGSPGDVYSFRITSFSSALHLTCPSTGIIYDTLRSGTYLSPVKQVAFECISSSSSDLEVFSVGLGTGSHAQAGYIYALNNYCAPVNAIVKLTNSPRVHYYSASPTPVSTTSTSVIWNIPALSVVSTGPTQLYYHLERTGSSFTPGDTLHSMVVITPYSGDVDTSNNVVVIVDTVRAGYDPNAIYVKPDGCIASGAAPTQLQYTITFENTGNDTAHNIYVMDTLPDYVDANSMRLVLASHEMYVSKIKWAGRTILKFDFPNIKLLDSSHHGLCDGAVIYTINTKPGLATGTDIMNRVGTYFDVNPVVMTNEAHNVIGCPPVVAVGSLQSSVGSLSVYPNPASDVLNIETSAGAFQNYSVTNSMGSVVMNGSADGAHTKLNIKNLPAGIYCIRLMGEQGVEVRKFVKE